MPSKSRNKRNFKKQNLSSTQGITSADKITKPSSSSPSSSRDNITKGKTIEHQHAPSGSTSSSHRIIMEDKTVEYQHAPSSSPSSNHSIIMKDKTVEPKRAPSGSLSSSRGSITDDKTVEPAHTSSDPLSSPARRETRSMARAKEGKIQALAPSLQIAAVDRESSQSHSAQPGPSMIHNVLEGNRFSFKASTNKEEQKRWTAPCFSLDQHLSYLQACFNKLDTEIFNFTNGILPLNCTWESLDNTIQAKLIAFCPKAAMLVDDGRNSSHIVLRAWIWRLLYDNLWSPDCTGKWLGKHWESFGELQRTLSGHVTNEDNMYNFTYHLVKHFTARMLYMLHGQHADPNQLTQIILNNIIPIARDGSNDSSTDPELSFDLKSRISQIVELAISADLYLQTSRYKITIEMHDPDTEKTSGFPYKKGLMKKLRTGLNVQSSRTQDPPIDFIFQPLIRSYGRARSALGDKATARVLGSTIYDYDECLATIPMLVVTPDELDSDDIDPLRRVMIEAVMGRKSNKNG